MTTAKMDRVGRLLEKVAREVSLVAYKEGHGAISKFEATLEARIGSLLRAGQAMRDGVIGASGGLKRIQLSRDWDAALAALEGRE